MAIGKQLSDNNPDGTVLGQSGDKIGFFGVATPTVKATGFVAPIATAATNTSPFGFATGAQADAIVTWVRAVDAELKAKGFIS